jgi:hypothetical protein
MRHQQQGTGYLYRIAYPLTKQLKAFDLIAMGLPVSGEAFMRVFSANVEGFLGKWSPEKLGRLATFGRGFVEGEDAGRSRNSLHAVHLGDHLFDRANGETLLRRIAAFTIVAAMLDIVENRLREQADRERMAR